MGKYIFSTSTANQKYPIYRDTGDKGLSVIKSYVLIHGGANLPSKVLVTPKGVMTSITDDEWDRLQKSSSFQKHRKRGFLTVEDAPTDADEVAGDMESRDKSAPMTRADFEDIGIKPPETSKSEADLDNTRVRATQRPTLAKVEEPDARGEPKAEEPKAEKPSGRKRRGAAAA